MSGQPDGPPGVIELPRVVDEAGAYQANPFRRTIEDAALFPGEAPCILVTHISDTSPVVKWRSQVLLIPQTGPGEVTYSAVSIYSYNETHMESGGHFSGEYLWASDVNGDGVDDVVVLGWRWGGPGWFGGDTPPPINEPTGVRIVIRDAIEQYPVGIASNTWYTWDDRHESPLKTVHLQDGRGCCVAPFWEDRIARAIAEWNESVD